MAVALHRFAFTIAGALLSWALASGLWYTIGALADGETLGDAVIGSFWGTVWFGLLIVPVLLTISIPISYFTDKKRTRVIRFSFYAIIAILSIYLLFLGIDAEEQSYDKPIYSIFGRVGLIWIMLDFYIIPELSNRFMKRKAVG